VPGHKAPSALGLARLTCSLHAVSAPAAEWPLPPTVATAAADFLAARAWLLLAAVAHSGELQSAILATALSTASALFLPQAPTASCT
jgi:hypothetical protein